MYKKYPYIIQKCDAVRYFILHRYGGLYVDMDYFCNKSWTEILNKYNGDIYFVQTPNNTGFDKIHISNSLMYSKAGHIFWNRLFIELEIKKEVPYYYSKHLVIMFTTGPGILNRFFNIYKIRDKLNFYPYEIFHPYGLNLEPKIASKDSNIYAFHIQDGSWHNTDTLILNFLYQEYKILLFILLILLSPLLFNIKLKDSR
jgi:mannosyltransferase OCH1-like enzyme